MINLFALLVAMLVTVAGCGNSAYVRDSGFKIGSATSKNLFIDSSQFVNRVVKLRIRNSSGDPALDIGVIRSQVEAGLRSAGYEIGDKGFGIVIDVNAYFMNSVANGRSRATNEIGALLGGVTGYELAKKPGGVGAGSGVILGAIAGATLQEVIRSSNEYDTYMVLCDVNIGIVRQESKKKDYFAIGGNKIEHQQDEERGRRTRPAEAAAWSAPGITARCHPGRDATSRFTAGRGTFLTGRPAKPPYPG